MENAAIFSAPAVPPLTPASQRLPVLFVSHGSPMFALEAGTTGPALTHWGQHLRAQFPQLRGVVILSPHWMAEGVRVMSNPAPETWHDFGGFPRALYQLQYPPTAPPPWRKRCWPCCSKPALPPRQMPSARWTTVPGCR